MTDVIGERTALEQHIYDLQCAVEARKHEGAEDCASLGQIGISIEYAEQLIIHLGSILAKYRMLEQAAEKHKNPPVISKSNKSRMLTAATIVRSARELLMNITLADPAAGAISKSVSGLLDSAVEMLEFND